MAILIVHSMNTNLTTIHATIFLHVDVPASTFSIYDLAARRTFFVRGTSACCRLVDTVYSAVTKKAVTWRHESSMKHDMRYGIHCVVWPLRRARGLHGARAVRCVRKDNVRTKKTGGGE
jgi:hypothetical protein